MLFILALKEGRRGGASIQEVQICIPTEIEVVVFLVSAEVRKINTQKTCLHSPENRPRCRPTGKNFRPAIFFSRGQPSTILRSPRGSTRYFTDT